MPPGAKRLTTRSTRAAASADPPSGAAAPGLQPIPTPAPRSEPEPEPQAPPPPPPASKQDDSVPGRPDPDPAPAANTRSSSATLQDDRPLFAPAPDQDSSDDDNDGKQPNAGSQESSPRTRKHEAKDSTRAKTIIASDASDLSDDGAEAGYESEDDPVVRSYDVFVTSELAQNLYLFQYPVRSAMKPYSKYHNSCPVDARLKPESGLIEVDVPVNTALNFDEEKGRAWGDVLRKVNAASQGGLGGKAMGSNGRRGKKQRVEKEDEEDEEDVMHMDFSEAIKKGRILSKQTLGSKLQPDETKYMVGVFKNDQLHLTPLRSTLQLRPQFPHVDAQLAQDRANKRLMSDEAEKPAEARAVHLSVKNTADPAAQMSSTQKALRIAEEEEWRKMQWVDEGENEAWDQYELLSLKNPESAEQLQCVTSKQEYMEWISGQKHI